MQNHVINFIEWVHIQNRFGKHGALFHSRNEEGISRHGHGTKANLLDDNLETAIWKVFAEMKQNAFTNEERQVETLTFPARVSYICFESAFIVIVQIEDVLYRAIVKKMASNKYESSIGSKFEKRERHAILIRGLHLAQLSARSFVLDAC